MNVALALSLLCVAPLPQQRSSERLPRRAGTAGPVVLNLGVAAIGAGSPTTGSDTSSLVGNRYAVLVVPETEQGQTDLDGDGDATDVVLMVHDGVSGKLVNTGHSVLAELLPFVHRGTVAVLLDEEHVDLNGDGDLFDNVAHLYDPRRDVLFNLRLSVPPTFVSVTRGRFLHRGDAFLLELIEGPDEDLNGDGDRDDVVLDLQLLGARSGVVPSTPTVARQTRAPRLATGHFPVASSLYVLDPEWLVLGVDEPDEGGRDLNGDGDALDANVLFATRATNGATHAIGVAGDALQLSNGIVAFRASEADQGQDLNADGDLLDGVLFVYDLEARVLTNLGLAATSVANHAGFVSALVDEDAQGTGDLNGDGDTDDNVVFVHDLVTGLTTNLGLSGAFLAARGAKLLFGVSETAQGVTDLNGDADAIDIVLHAHDLPTRTTANLATAVAGAARIGERFVSVYVDELSQGADFNFDGDLADQVLGVYDAQNDTFANTALAASPFTLRIPESGGSLAVGVPEAGQGGLDRNGDGDADDTVLHLWESDVAGSRNLGLAIRDERDVGFAHGRLLVLVREAGEGADLNGDGDTLDHVAHLVELAR